MSVPPLNSSILKEIASRLSITLDDADAHAFLSVMGGLIDDYAAIDALPNAIPEVRYPRERGHRAGPDESCGNAWYWRSRVQGAAFGKLAGRTVALKDNINLAGVPMMNGASMLEGHVPAFDATVVTRLLDAGATILGKATCEQFCLSGGSHTSQPAPVENPRRPGRSAGGSSSGSAALVAAGEVDMALGGDQGGSIRIPSAFCGTYGMKPTHGLVPYTGIMPIEATVDHCGPITSTVRDNALMLEVLAGPDGMDPRQFGNPAVCYEDFLDMGAAGLRIGLVEEGFRLADDAPALCESVRNAARVLERLGARIETISVPDHLTGATLWTPIGCEGLLAQMMKANGGGYNSIGLQDAGLIERQSTWREHVDTLSPSLKTCMFVGEYGMSLLHGRIHAKAQNIRLAVIRNFAALFDRVDLLLMPTVPMVATPLPEPGAGIAEVVTRAFEMIGNTATYDITGHPAMSVPCGIVDGLPVGMMLVARHHGEGTIYRAAAAYERACDWMSC